MATNALWNAPDLVPAIAYSELTRAIEWLERVFGFRERADAQLAWPGGGMTWIEVGNGLFNIVTRTEEVRQDSSGAAPGVVMKVCVDDIGRHFSRAKAKGAKIISEPEGGRIYRALDHEGHQWVIAQRGRDLAAEHWQLPPGVTRGVAKCRSRPTRPATERRKLRSRFPRRSAFRRRLRASAGRQSTSSDFRGNV